MSKEILTADYLKSTQVSSLEAQVLTQYQFLATQLNVLAGEIGHLTQKSSQVQANQDQGGDSGNGSAHTLAESLRNLERKIGLIHTLFKGAVYTLFLEQDNGMDEVDADEDAEIAGDRHGQDED